MRRSIGHLPEYLMEALGLGLFMISAATFGTLIEHPASPVRAAIADPFPRRVLMGLAMGLTSVALVYSPWGRRSGAHTRGEWYRSRVRAGAGQASRW